MCEPPAAEHSSPKRRQLRSQARSSFSPALAVAAASGAVLPASDMSHSSQHRHQHQHQQHSLHQPLQQPHRQLSNRDSTQLMSDADSLLAPPTSPLPLVTLDDSHQAARTLSHGDSACSYSCGFDSDDSDCISDIDIDERRSHAITDPVRALPRELCFLIMAFLTKASDVVSAALVCTRWHEIAMDSATWRAVYMNQPGWMAQLAPAPPLPTDDHLHQQQYQQQHQNHHQQDQYQHQQQQHESLVADSGQHELSGVLRKAQWRLRDFRSTSWRTRFRERLTLAKRAANPAATTPLVLRDHTDAVYCLQFDRDRLFTGSRDRSIKVWDTATWRCIATLKRHTASVLCLRYSPEMIVTGSSDCNVIIWGPKARTSRHAAPAPQAAPGEPPHPAGFSAKCRLVSHTAGVLDVVFDWDMIVSCSKDGFIKVWRPRPDMLRRHERGEVASLVDLWEAPELTMSLRGHSGPVNALQLFHYGGGDAATQPSLQQRRRPDGARRLVSAGSDNVIRLWNPDSDVCLREFRGHTRGLACLQCDGRRIISGSNDQTIKVWDVETGECLVTMRGHNDLVRSLYYQGTVVDYGASSGGSAVLRGGRVVSGSYDRTVKVWDVDTGSCLMTLPADHDSWVFAVQLSATRIVSASQDGTVVVYDFGAGLDTSYLDGFAF